MRGYRSREFIVASVLLAVAAAFCAVWLVAMGKGTAFQGDELFYYANLVLSHGLPEPVHGVEYFFAPHNGHLVIGGRLLYRLMFALFGTDYVWFRIAAALSYVACVVLFYALAVRRVRPLLAVVFCVSLLFLGFGYEVMLWPFDIHTTLALSLGLGAILALERDDRTGDVLACVLLVLSVSLIEVGLCFSVGAAVLVLQRGRERWRGLWIAAVPIALYAIWWIWARKFDASEGSLAYANLIPRIELEALAAVLGSLTGINPTGPGVPVGLTEVTTAAMILASLAVVAVAWRLWRRRVPPTLWAWLAIVFAYWVTIALGDRPPDSTRYIFVGAVIVLLIACDALARVEIPIWAVALAALALVLTIPPNVDKITEGRNSWLTIARVSGAEFGMLDAARNTVDPGYAPASDPKVVEFGGGLFVPLSAGEYFDGEDSYGGLGYSQEHIRGLERLYREVADSTLVGATRAQLETVPEPDSQADCSELLKPRPNRPVQFVLPADGARLGSRTGRPIEVAIQHFANGRGRSVGTLEAHRWARVTPPPQTVSRGAWRAVVDGPVTVCPTG